MSSPEVDLVRRLFDDWREKGELPGDELIAADFELHSPISAARGEPFRGRQGARDWADELNERFPGFRFELEQLEQHGERVLALGQLAADGLGTAPGYSREEGWLLEVHGGRIRRLEVFADPAEAREAAMVRT